MDRKYLQPQPASKGLILHYRLWTPNGGTVAYDYSQQGNHGVLTGTTFTSKYPGLHMAGSDEYIETGSAFQSTFRASFSVGLWLDPDDGRPAASKVPFGVLDAAQNNIVECLLLNTGKLQFIYEANNNAGNVAETASAVFSDGAQNFPTHLLFVADSANGKSIYVNGALETLDGVKDGSVSGVTFTEYTSTDTLSFGAYSFNGAHDDELAGLFGDVMIFNRALSAADAKSLYETTRWRYQA
jgi:hypothetical protein